MISGSRVDINVSKESPLDFTLWKTTDKGIQFDSPFSKGRPGWHTECVAMIDDIFGEEIDIHGGGVDLKFPHHENEIAQGKAMHNHQVAKYWIHNGRVSFKNEKMSKSIGNGILVKDVLEKMALRYFLLSTHYRAPLNYTDEGFTMYIKEYEKLEKTLKSLFFKLDLENKFNKDIKITEKSVEEELNNFDLAMNNDFNTANAITSLQGMLKLANINIRKPNNFDILNQIYNALIYMIDILGFKVELNLISNENREIYKEWQNARKNKDYALADKLRNILTKKGIL